VVNFIMNDHFEGVQFDWNGSGYNHQQNSSIGGIVAGKELTNPAQYHVPGDVGLDGQTQSFALTLGSNFANGKGNATTFFSWQQQNPVLQSSRDFSACSIAGGKTAYTCAGSSTTAPGGRFVDFINSNFDVTIANAAGGVRPYVGATDSFNFAPYNYFQRPDTRYLANFFAHYDALPEVRVYTEFDFMNDHTLAQIAPSGSFLQSYTLHDENPLLSQSFKDATGITAATPQIVYIGRRNIEGGGRIADFTHQNFRIVAGAKGSLWENKWDYNAWWQTGQNTTNQIYRNDFSVRRLGNAFDVITDPATGLPACRSFVNGADKNCVPYDVFHLGGVTQAALNYLQTPGFQNGSTSQSIVGITATSDLGSSYGLQLPWARDGIGVAFGIERRVEKLTVTTDVEFDTGDLAGQNGATHGLEGQFTVVEPYAEIRVPIAQRQPWAYDLSVNAAYRYSNYNTGVRTNSYGIGAEWAPIKEGKLRGSYQQAVRAANIIELFTPQFINLYNGGDPCAGPTPTASLAGCLRTGLTAGQYGANGLSSPAGQYNYLVGGNPTLSPETAKTYTFGVVLTPMPNLSATIDYWHFDVQNTITIIKPNQALNNCINVGLNCDLIHRSPTNGNLWVPGGGFITGLNQNIGSIKTDGVDFTLNWSTPIDNYGSVAVGLAGTYTNEYVTEPIPGLGTYDCAGLFGITCGIPLPKWKSRLQGVWNTPWQVSAAVTWRYLSAVDLDLTQSNSILAGASSPLDSHIGAQNYFDLALQWIVNKNFTVRGGVNNIADRDPPVVSSTAGAFPSISGPSLGNGNTFPQVYDTLGRFFFLSATAKF
jgi:outer membrane receptor protein involved in Fe transport